ncbi:Vacuolar protease A, partial [Blyttiomyces sp. JEL0837]
MNTAARWMTIAAIVISCAHLADCSATDSNNDGITRLAITKRLPDSSTPLSTVLKSHLGYMQSRFTNMDSLTAASKISSGTKQHGHAPIVIKHGHKVPTVSDSDSSDNGSSSFVGNRRDTTGGSTQWQIGDSGDVSYYGTITLGTPPQEFQWVASSSCITCKNGHYFTPSLSSTFNSTSPTSSSSKSLISVTYGNGIVKGYQSYDTFTISTITLKNQPFLLVTDEDSQMQASNAGIWDGVLGLCYQNGNGNGDSTSTSTTPSKASATSSSEHNTIIYNMNNQNKLSNPVFSIWLNGSIDSRYHIQGGELSFGNVDSSRYTGDLIYFKVPTIPVINSKYFWSVYARGISFGDVQNPIDTFLVPDSKSENTFAILDTGSTLISVDSDTFNNVFLNFLKDKIVLDQNGGLYTLDCINTVPKLPNLNFLLSNSSVTTTESSTNDTGIIGFSLTWRDYILYQNNVCYLGVGVLDNIATGNAIWVMGDVFLRKFFSVYDFGRGSVALGLSVGGSLSQGNPGWGNSSVVGTSGANGTVGGSENGNGTGTTSSGNVSIAGVTEAPRSGGKSSSGGV